MKCFVFNCNNKYISNVKQYFKKVSQNITKFGLSLLLLKQKLNLLIYSEISNYNKCLITSVLFSDFSKGKSNRPTCNMYINNIYFCSRLYIPQYILGKETAIQRISR